MKSVLKKGEIEFGLTKEGKKFKNDSDSASKFQDKRLFNLAYKATFSKEEK
jgi:hypothetical protein